MKKYYLYSWLFSFLVALIMIFVSLVVLCLSNFSTETYIIVLSVICGVSVVTALISNIVILKHNNTLNIKSAIISSLLVIVGMIPLIAYLVDFYILNNLINGFLNIAPELMDTIKDLE